MRKALGAIFLAGALCVPAISQAHDLGVMGRTWPIVEQNITLRLMQRATKVNWQKVHDNLMKQAKHKLANMPMVDLHQAKYTTVHYVDPSLTLAHKITAPVKIGNKFDWRVVYPKGTKVNPLAAGLRPVTRMLFYNPKDPRQAKFALAAKRAYPTLVILVALGGDLSKYSTQIGQPVFYALPSLVSKFQLNAVPALVGVGYGKHKNDLAIVQYGTQVVEKGGASVGTTIQRSWYGNIKGLPGVQK